MFTTTYRSILKACITLVFAATLFSCTDVAPGPAYPALPHTTMEGGTGGTGGGTSTGSGNTGDDDDPIIQQNGADTTQVPGNNG